ncbi:hypothetical protein GQR58_007712 [Nymphon striatum]|nr:hypothetical protein GQR58_007712 [Nymphon striatum]
MEVGNAFKNHDPDEARRAFSQLTSISGTIISMLKAFDDEQVQRPQFAFWLVYMEMVSILLNFIRAEREGNWELHLESFKRMLPWFAVYNHTNYARWGPVYLADMCQLPSRDEARDKWCLAYNEKSQMADAAYKMFGIDVDRDVDAEWTNQEVGPTRLVRDEEDLCKIMAEFQRLGVFTDTEEHVEDLVCLATKDVVPDSIKEDVLKARERGTTLVEEFVTTRLI